MIFCVGYIKLYLHLSLLLPPPAHDISVLITSKVDMQPAFCESAQTLYIFWQIPNVWIAKVISADHTFIEVDNFVSVKGRKTSWEKASNWNPDALDMYIYNSTWQLFIVIHASRI